VHFICLHYVTALQFTVQKNISLILLAPLRTSRRAARNVQKIKVQRMYVEILLSPEWHRLFRIVSGTERISLLEDTVPFFVNASLIAQPIKHRPLLRH
jgi:hypothetical protein